MYDMYELYDKQIILRLNLVQKKDTLLDLFLNHIYFWLSAQLALLLM